MLWRVIAVAALPGCIPTLVLVNELRKFQAQQPRPAAAITQMRADFLCDASGTIVQTQAQPGVAVSTLTHSAVPEVVVTAVATVTTMADATGQAMSWAAAATLDMAKDAADSAMDAVSSLKRTITNDDRIAELRNEAEILANLHGSQAWLNLLRAMFATGIAIAAADGEISESERIDILEYVGGAAHTSLPAGLVAAVHGWLTCPPTIEQAFALARECGEENMALIETVMDVVTHADAVEHPAEAAFREKWHSLREAARA